MDQISFQNLKTDNHFLPVIQRKTYPFPQRLPFKLFLIPSKNISQKPRTVNNPKNIPSINFNSALELKQ